jgi:hypothetical protein
MFSILFIFLLFPAKFALPDYVSFSRYGNSPPEDKLYRDRVEIEELRVKITTLDCRAGFARSQ